MLLQFLEGKMDYTELGVKALDEKTLEVTLEKPIPYFLSLMSFRNILTTKRRIRYMRKAKTTRKTLNALLYNGPFTLADWDGTGLSWKLS